MTGKLFDVNDRGFISIFKKHRGGITVKVKRAFTASKTFAESVFVMSPDLHVIYDTISGLYMSPVEIFVYGSKPVISRQFREEGVSQRQLCPSRELKSLRNQCPLLK